MKPHEAYKALPAKVAQQVLKVLDKNWESYQEACKVWNEDSSKFLGHPKLPKYKDKQKGRNILVFTVQAVSKKGLKKGSIHPSSVPIEVPTKRGACIPSSPSSTDCHSPYEAESKRSIERHTFGTI